jgi:type I restriction enzyme, R subunit
LGKRAEENLHPDPNGTLVKLRMFGESMARIIYAEEKLEKPEPSDQYERLKSLRYRGELPQEVIGMFHSLRKKGNEAVHDFVGTFEEARAEIGRIIAMK